MDQHFEFPKPKYKATRLWNELVKSFRQGIETKRHRWHIKTYDNCFTGSEAVDFLYHHMQWTGTFGHVTRQQAQKLCQKFLETCIIADARGKQEKNKFQDDGHLYKCIEPRVSPRKRPARAALSTVVVANTYAHMDKTPAKKARVDAGGFEDSDGSEKMDVIVENREADLVEMRQLELGDGTPEEVGHVWKEITISRLLQLVELPTLDDVLKVHKVNGKHIATNANHIAQVFMSKPHCFDNDETTEQAASGVRDTLPYWVISAMEFLKKWPHGDPEQCGFTLPVYRGFDRDVLMAVEDYFHSMPQPLIPMEMFDLHTAIIGLIQSGQSTATDALQMSTLLISPLSRAQLLQLLIFMNAIIRSHTLSLSRDRSNRQVLVKLFGPVILQSCNKPPIEEAEPVALLVNYLLDNYAQIFTIPGEIEERVKQRLECKNKETDVAMVVESSCHQVTQQCYVEQMKEASQQAITQLLDKIIEDHHMPSKDKKQKLKQFQKAHPDIFTEKFPDGCPLIDHSQKHKTPRKNSIKWKVSFKLKSHLR